MIAWLIEKMFGPIPPQEYWDQLIADNSPWKDEDPCPSK